MPSPLPRFNQEFVRRLDADSAESRFVSAVGDYTFLGNLHADRIAQVEVELRHPVTFSLFESEEAHRAYASAYAANFEQILINDGLEELVFALNSLKVSVDGLKGKRISWIESTFKRGSEYILNEAHIMGSNIGFGYHSYVNPSLDIEVSDENDEDDIYVISLPYMWDITL